MLPKITAARVAGLLFAVAVGAALGLGGYTFVYAKGASYLSSNPEACANCHIMQEQFDGWTHSSHRAVAGCNDCHTPARKQFKRALDLAEAQDAIAIHEIDNVVYLRLQPRAATDG